MRPRLRFKLREAVADYENRTGERMTHRELARKAGISPDTVKKISNTRRRYNATLHTVERLCWALGISPVELLDWQE